MKKKTLCTIATIAALLTQGCSNPAKDFLKEEGTKGQKIMYFDEETADEDWISEINVEWKSNKDAIIINMYVTEQDTLGGYQLIDTKPFNSIDKISYFVMHAKDKQPYKVTNTTPLPKTDMMYPVLKEYTYELFKEAQFKEK